MKNKAQIKNFRWHEVLSHLYKAHVADVDGNLVGENEPSDCLSDEIIKRIEQKLKKGIPFGLASARSFRPNQLLDNVQKKIMSDLPLSSAQHFYIFAEQGTQALWIEPDQNGRPIHRQLDLVQFFHRVPAGFLALTEDDRQKQFEKIKSALYKNNKHFSLRYKSSKKYGFLARIESLIDSSKTPSQTEIKIITQQVRQILNSHYPDYEAFCTRTSLFVSLKGSSKKLSLEFLSSRYQIPIDDIVGTDDQADIYGVGWHLTQHKGGFSTNTFDPNAIYQIPLKKILHQTGKEAWMMLDNLLHYNSPSKNRFFIKLSDIVNEQNFFR